MYRTLILASLALFSGCRSYVPATAAAEIESLELKAIEYTLDRLYGAFCFDAGGEPDWDTIRELSAQGATYFAPISPGTDPRGVSSESFIADFRGYAESLSTTGLHETVRRTRIDVYGTIAHAYVAFDAFVPGQEEEARSGLDSIQLVLSSKGWRVASFTTQWETETLSLPERFQ